MRYSWLIEYYQRTFHRAGRWWRHFIIGTIGDDSSSSRILYVLYRKEDYLDHSFLNLCRASGIVSDNDTDRKRDHRTSDDAFRVNWEIGPTYVKSWTSNIELIINPAGQLRPRTAILPPLSLCIRHSACNPRCNRSRTGRSRQVWLAT